MGPDIFRCGGNGLAGRHDRVRCRVRGGPAVRSIIRALAAVPIIAALGAAAPSALAAMPAAPQAPLPANPGAQEPSLSVVASPSGGVDAAVIGKNQSLWYFSQSNGTWHRTEVAGSGTAFSGPSLGVTFTKSEIAVQGAGHTLMLYYTAAGRWRHLQIAGANHAYSAPSLYIGPAGPGIAVEGARHTLWYYRPVKGHWRGRQVDGSGTDYSAPSLVIRYGTQVEPGGPAGQADIAVEGAAHTLSYYNSLAFGHWNVTLVGGRNSTYSAPSLIVGYGAYEGAADIAVQGPGHSVVFRADVVGSRPGNPVTLDQHGVFSAPSMFQSSEDPQGQFEIAFQGESHSVTFLYYSPAGAGSFVNDVISSATGQVYSAPSLFAGTIPTLGYDLLFQGKGNSLFYYHAPAPASGAPVFTGSRISKAGTIFGG